MSATIKYKGNTIATITTDSSKTLKTSGKYCEGDIVVENVQDGGGGGKATIETFCYANTANQFLCDTWSPSVTAVEYIPPKYYYNGVLLPEIPADVLAKYPYAFIGLVQSTGQYQILASTQPMYFYNAGIKRQNGNSEPFLHCVESDETWTSGASGNYGWSIDSDRIIIWSNHDIPNGSATATEIYFNGSEPVPAE